MRGRQEQEVRVSHCVVATPPATSAAGAGNGTSVLQTQGATASEQGVT